MKLTKKRIAELRASASCQPKHRAVSVCACELITLLDAYARQPDEVAEGFKNFTEPTLFIDDDYGQLVAVLDTARVDDNDTHVLVHVYYLTKGGRRG